ncbi:MAG: hypothetical protein LBL99_03895 [Holosporaceae bacterium]|jgi:hypothetical protein|nr:hypothetical protein [Holosporaceae bacterium]
MRVLNCLGLILCVASVFAEEKAEEPKDSASPKVYVDISEAAQEDAVSFDGIRGLLGLSLTLQNFEASVDDAKNFTKNNMNLFGLCIGAEYAKTFRKGFLIAVDVYMDAVAKSSKDGSWGDLNLEYENRRGAAWSGEKTATLKRSAISPMLALKCGYLMPAYKSMAFVKLGVSNVSGSYRYEVDGSTVCDADFSVFTPSVGIGIERKINKKWGAFLEANLAIKKNTKIKRDGAEHNVKIGRVDIRLMASYAISNNK